MNPIFSLGLASLLTLDMSDMYGVAPQKSNRPIMSEEEYMRAQLAAQRDIAKAEEKRARKAAKLIKNNNK